MGKRQPAGAPRQGPPPCCTTAHGSPPPKWLLYPAHPSHIMIPWCLEKVLPECRQENSPRRGHWTPSTTPVTATRLALSSRTDRFGDTSTDCRRHPHHCLSNPDRVPVQGKCASERESVSGSCSVNKGRRRVELISRRTRPRPRATTTNPITVRMKSLPDTVKPRFLCSISLICGLRDKFTAASAKQVFSASQQSSRRDARRLIVVQSDGY